MAFVGNKNGPRESRILEKLGANYFGCSTDALEEDISHHLRTEQRGEVVPVHVDDSGQPYINYNAPKRGEVQRFYLEEHGIFLHGDIETFDEREKHFWEQRKRKAMNR
jgi:hypothetical protein